MITAWENTEKAGRKKPVKPYVIKVNESSGAIYLERERNPLFMELPYVTALIIAVLFALISCCGYIQLKTDVEVQIRRTEALERQLHILQNDNDLAEKDMSYAQDLDYIYKEATLVLGMVPVAEANVLFYDRSDSEYVYQRDRIPFAEIRSH